MPYSVEIRDWEKKTKERDGGFTSLQEAKGACARLLRLATPDKSYGLVKDEGDAIVAHYVNKKGKAAFK